MNEQDKAAARRALERKQLTIDQVEQIRAEVDRSGRPFRDVARGLGLLAAPPPPARRIPTLYLALLAGSFVIFSGLLIATVVMMRERSLKDEELALETERSRAEAERRGIEAGRGYQRGIVATNEAAAREKLIKARIAMARADQLQGAGGTPAEINRALNEAFVAYNMVLQELPGDAAIRIERARTHELRRNYDLAIADLEHARALKPELAPGLTDKIAQLRLLLARERK